jgi:hypothetical protein
VAAVKQYRRMSELLDVTGSSGTGKSPVGDGTEQFPLTHVATTADITAILAGVAAVEWIYLEPLNGFENLPNLFGDNWAPLRYRHTLNNIVHLEGLVKPPTGQSGSPIVIAVMPEECRSGYDLVFPAKSSIPNEEGHIYLRSDGRLELASAYPWAWVSLCGISWSVEGTSPVVATALAGLR